MKHFNVFDPDSHIMLWGCSATLVRMDTIALGNLFEAITFSLDMNYMILQKWYWMSFDRVSFFKQHVCLTHLYMICILRLCSPEIIRVKSSISLRDVKDVSSGEDYDLGKLSLTINTPTRNMIIFEEWYKLAHLRKTLSLLLRYSTIPFVYPLADIHIYIYAYIYIYRKTM